MIKIGIGGNLGSGKSTVAKFLSSYGGKIIDADKITHELLQKEKIINKIKKIFPEVISNDKVLKKKLARLVFKNKDNYQKYYKMIMPEILKIMDKRLKENDGKFLIIDAPLLFETGLYKKMDYNILVSCSQRLKIERMLKKGFKKDDILARLKFQMKEKDFKKYADFIIVNNKDKKYLKKEVVKILEKIWK